MSDAPRTVTRVCVYCASSAQAAPQFAALAYELGRRFAEAGITSVYGGGGIGSMGRFADGVLDAGGRIVGVIPRFMIPLEWAHPRVADLIVTDDMRSRKHRMIEDVDAVVALPGGCGTLEELLEVVTLKRLGEFTPPVVIVNQDDFYRPLLEQLQRCIDERFMIPRHAEMWSVVGTAAEVVPAIHNAPAWSPAARSFAVQRPSAAQS